MEILIHCHESTIDKNLRYLGISPDSKKFKVISFKSQREYALGFNDTYDSELVLDVPENWDHPKIRNAGERGVFRTLQAFRNYSLIIPPKF